MVMASTTAGRYHLNADHFAAVIACESSWDPSVQSGYKNPDGTQERSYGLAQINLDANPTISLDEATDPEFALRFMAQSWAEGYARHWTCWDKKQASGWSR